MRFKNWIRGVVLGMFATVSIASTQSAMATDIPIFPTGPVYRLTNLVWGTSTQPGFNNNYFFTPLNLNESVCVYVKNNNTTNPHTFQIQIAINSDPNNITPSDGTWLNMATAPNAVAATSPGISGGIGTNISGVAQVSINLSGSITQGGAPDTANVSIIQSPQGNCPSGQNFIGNAPITVSGAPPIQVVSEGLSQSYVSSASFANPVLNQTILHINAQSGARFIYFDRVVISASAAATIFVNTTSSVGTTCTAAIIQNERAGGPTPASTATANFNCTGSNPGIGSSLFGGNGGTGNGFPIAAGSSVILDLRGMIATAGTPNGIDVTMQAALTGNIQVTFFWYEK